MTDGNPAISDCRRVARAAQSRHGQFRRPRTDSITLFTRRHAERDGAKRTAGAAFADAGPPPI